jgi:hypothetical protein
VKIALRLALLLFLVVPAVAWFVVKPVRVLVPEAVGMVCVEEHLCVDAPEMLPQARALYDVSKAFVDAHVGALQGRPLVVFCATESCAVRFGLGDRSAVTLGTVGTVIGPRAWKAYYVQHELIHHLQGQRFGVLRRLFMPSWLIEGMAYALSRDPRPTLAEPWQAYRTHFTDWLARIGPERMWQEAARL